MNKLALNCIVKNESHCILKMLNSAKQISDLIVIVDTGSTDGTQDIIRNFGIENNIPTYVFERTFDNFENSRNFAMQKLKDVIQDLNWDKNKTWGWWCDADETLVVEGFTKNQLDKDFYMIHTHIDTMKYTRNTFFRLSKEFEWYGVLHEFIRPKEQVTSGLLTGLYVDVKMIGNSWQGDIGDKYLSHAHILEKHISKDRSDPRWIFYTGQSYYDSSNIDNKLDSEERLRRAIYFYRERLNRKDGYEEERFYSQYRIGTCMLRMQLPWKETKEELLKAYSLDPLRGEPIKAIVDYYVSISDWNLAYIYSKFMKINFHNKNPYPKRLLFIDQSLYSWKILEIHSAICFYLSKREEAKQNYFELIETIKNSPQLFNENELSKIKSNERFFT